MIDISQETLKTLRAIPTLLEALTAGVTAEDAAARPEPGEWSAVEVVAHMLDVERHAVERARRILGEDTPFLPGFDHEQLAVDSDYRRADLAQTVQAYCDLRASHIQLLTDLEPGAWHRSATHEVHDRMTLLEYEVHVAAEEVDHLAQLARALPG
jgi:hypothetical protein